MKFVSTIKMNDFDFSKIKPGQWVSLSGDRGQYLGTGKSGTIVIRWQNGRFGSTGNSPKIDAKNNGLLRQYARNIGSK